VDFLGQGLSSRPTYTLTDTVESIGFFVDSLEKWRQALGLKKFNLAGHSLGGYLAAHYAMKYPEYVSKLSLISAAGITKRNDNFNVDEWLKSVSFVRRQFIKMAIGYWNDKKTPQQAFNSLGFVGRNLLKRYIKNRFKRPETENEMLYNYYSNALTLPDSSEKALHYILKLPRASAILPAEEFLGESKMPIDFFYGDIDWMDISGATRVCENSDGRCKLIKITKAGHHINMDNPDELAEAIINNSKGLLEAIQKAQSSNHVVMEKCLQKSDVKEEVEEIVT